MKCNSTKDFYSAMRVYCIVHNLLIMYPLPAVLLSTVRQLSNFLTVSLVVGGVVGICRV